MIQNIILSGMVPITAAINVRIVGPSTSYSAYDVSAIATQLNNMLAATSGYSGSSAAATVLSGTKPHGSVLSSHLSRRHPGRVTGDYDYLVILPETEFLYSYPEMTFDGVLQMSRKALNAGTTPLLLMPGTGASLLCHMPSAPTPIESPMAAGFKLCPEAMRRNRRVY
jgi:hypothetical protein